LGDVGFAVQKSEPQSASYAAQVGLMTTKD
jgi:hypothetical protein